MRRDRGRRRAFTLIELLVVVAIIALLISILLPSLSRARAQARTSICASRITQVAKAILMYADDYDGATPFLGRGWEDCDNLSDVEWPTGSGMTVKQWAYAENWVMPNMPDYWFDRQEIWPAYADVRNGSLFGYTRFEGLYRCPDFERVSDPGKFQNAFNYTRTMLGRKWYDYNDPEAQDGSPWRADYDGPFGAPGPVLRIGQAYAPSRLYMLLDERWSHHCANPSLDGSAGTGVLDGQITGMWLAIETIWTIGDEGGQYHGSERVSSTMPGDLVNLMTPIKGGNAAFFDGHVKLDTDILPDRLIDEDWGLDIVRAGLVFFEWMREMMFTQRGKATLLVNFTL